MVSFNLSSEVVSKAWIVSVNFCISVENHAGGSEACSPVLAIAIAISGSLCAAVASSGSADVVSFTKSKSQTELPVCFLPVSRALRDIKIVRVRFCAIYLRCSGLFVEIVQIASEGQTRATIHLAAIPEVADLRFNKNPV